MKQSIIAALTASFLLATNADALNARDLEIRQMLTNAFEGNIPAQLDVISCLPGEGEIICHYLQTFHDKHLVPMQIERAMAKLNLWDEDLLFIVIGHMPTNSCPLFRQSLFDRGINRFCTGQEEPDFFQKQRENNESQLRKYSDGWNAIKANLSAGILVNPQDISRCIIELSTWMDEPAYIAFLEDLYMVLSNFLIMHPQANFDDIYPNLQNLYRTHGSPTIREKIARIGEIIARRR